MKLLPKHFEKTIETFLLVFLSLGVFELQAQIDNEDETENILIDPELIASFPGGNDSLTSFIERNLVVPRACHSTGNVYVAFLVNKDGTLSEFEVEKGLSKSCDKSALDVVKKMPQWKPGRMWGEPVQQRLVLPIKF
jgi:protein TonB